MKQVITSNPISTQLGGLWPRKDLDSAGYSTEVLKAVGFNAPWLNTWGLGSANSLYKYPQCNEG